MKTAKLNTTTPGTIISIILTLMLSMGIGCSNGEGSINPLVPSTTSEQIDRDSEFVIDFHPELAEPIPVVPVPIWIRGDFPLASNLASLDIGVISDPGGTRDSQILMAASSSITSNSIIAWYPNYALNYVYVPILSSLDPSNSNFRPSPVERIDAASTGAFGITNNNPFYYNTIFGKDYTNDQVWSVFDASLNIHTGATPFQSRYINVFLGPTQAKSYPVDTCDDFDDCQYSLFCTDMPISFRDIMFVGTRANTYTQNRIHYIANLDAWSGVGSGLVDSRRVHGIDVDEHYNGDLDSAFLYILECWGANIEVEVFRITDDAPGWGFDSVFHVMTIPLYSDLVTKVHDIELLPINSNYDLCTTDPILAVLCSGGQATPDRGKVVLFNATTGAYLGILEPWFDVGDKMAYLDTDDDDWEVHVTWTDANGNPMASIYTYL